MTCAGFQEAATPHCDLIRARSIVWAALVTLNGNLASFDDHESSLREGQDRPEVKVKRMIFWFGLA